MIKNIYFRLVCLFILLFVVCCSAEIFVNNYAYEKGKPINKVKIPDIIQESIPIIRNLDVVSDLFTTFFSFVFLIIFVINGKYQYIILYFFVFLLMRLVTYIYYVSTTLPDSSKKCTFGSNFFESTMNMGSCNNLGISGHFINTVFQLGLLYHYYGSAYWLLYFIVYGLAFILICASRNHYTIDCITSTFVGLFFIYEIDNIQKGLNFVLGEKYFILKK
jgi:hypothetical protein